MFLRDYPAELTPNGEGVFVVTFPDVPEAITEIMDESELEETATDCLVTAVDFYIEDHRPFPSPSKKKKKSGNYSITSINKRKNIIAKYNDCK